MVSGQPSLRCPLSGPMEISLGLSISSPVLLATWKSGTPCPGESTVAELYAWADHQAPEETIWAIVVE